LITHECHSNGKLPEKQIIFKSEVLGSPKENAGIEAFLQYAVIATPESYKKFKSDLFSGISIADNEFLFSGGFTGAIAELDNLYKTISFDKPACIITGRQDNAVGYSYAYELLERFPRATFAIIDCAGHNLQIDNELIFSQLIKDWIWRIELSKAIVRA